MRPEGPGHLASGWGVLAKAKANLPCKLVASRLATRISRGITRLFALPTWQFYCIAIHFVCLFDCYRGSRMTSTMAPRTP